MLAKLSIAVVDDHPLFRSGVVSVLNGSNRFSVVGEGASANDAISLVAATAPDLLLVDLQLPGGGLEAAEAIVANSPTKIMVLTVVNHVEAVERALRIGVCGYLVKGISANELISAAEAVARGERYVSPECVSQLLNRLSKSPSNQWSDDAAVVQFAPREEDILALLSQGMTNKQIAFRLSVAEKTVKCYLTHIMRKIVAKNRVEVALFAARRTLMHKFRVSNRNALQSTLSHRAYVGAPILKAGHFGPRRIPRAAGFADHSLGLQHGDRR